MPSSGLPSLTQVLCSAPNAPSLPSLLKMPSQCTQPSQVPASPHLLRRFSGSLPWDPTTVGSPIVLTLITGCSVPVCCPTKQELRGGGGAGGRRGVWKDSVHENVLEVRMAKGCIRLNFQPVLPHRTLPGVQCFGEMQEVELCFPCELMRDRSKVIAKIVRA